MKPLLWLWYSFDRSPLGGQHVHLGIRFRRLLAPRIFARCGENFKCFQHVEFSFGYNLEVGDNVVVHRHVLLDDRGGITLGNRVSISDYANIYSHTHSIVEQREVTNARTVLEDDVRITYHATVLAGVRVRANAMVGAMALATKDVRSVSRERRDPGQVGPGQAECAAGGIRDRAGWRPRLRGAVALSTSILARGAGRRHWDSASLLVPIRARRLIAQEPDRQQLALQLDRRINEIFSLQELSYVLAESLQLERVAEQVARYTMRFLQADGRDRDPGRRGRQSA